MQTIKLFAKLLIVFVLFYIFVDFISFYYVKTTYNDINKYEVKSEKSNVEVIESKATELNGYCIGKITNTTTSNLDRIFVAVDCISEYGNNLETRYVEIDNIQAGETKDFKVDYRCQKVDSLKIYTSDTVPEKYRIQKEYDNDTKVSFLLSSLIFLYFFG